MSFVSSSISTMLFPFFFPGFPLVAFLDLTAFLPSSTNSEILLPALVVSPLFSNDVLARLIRFSSLGCTGI